MLPTLDFWRLCLMAFLPWLYKLAVCCFSLISKEGFFIPYQAYLILKADQIWSAFHGMEAPCTAPVLRVHEATYWFISHNVEENSRGRKGKGSFSEQRYIWASVLNRIHISTMSLPISCLWSLCKGHFALVVRTSFVLLIPEYKR